MTPDADLLRVLREMRSGFSTRNRYYAALTAAIERWERLAGLREQVEAWRNEASHDVADISIGELMGDRAIAQRDAYDAVLALMQETGP